MIPQPSETRHGDCGSGRAVAVLYAREGAKVGTLYLNEDDDARETRRPVEAEGQPCTILSGYVGGVETCRMAVERIVGDQKRHGRLHPVAVHGIERPRHPHNAVAPVRSGPR